MKRSPRGNTLLELMIALLLQAIILAVLYFAGPNLWQTISNTKKARAGHDASMLYYAMWGPNEDYNGFVGDNGYQGVLPSDWIGFIPNGNTTSVTYNWMKDNLTYFSAPNKPFVMLNGATGGWNGPYAPLAFNHEALKADPWGNSWKIDSDGTIRSAGYDQILNTADDITSNPGPMVLGKFGTVYIRVLDPNGAPLGSQLDIDGNQIAADSYLTVQVTNPTPGGATAMTWTNATWDQANQYFVVTDLWPGRHAIQVTGGRGVETLFPNGSPDKWSNAICDGSVPGEGHLKTCEGLWGSEIAYVRGGAIATINVSLTNVTVPQT